MDHHNVPTYQKVSAAIQHSQRTMLATIQYVLSCTEQGIAPAAWVLEQAKNLVAAGAESDGEEDGSSDKDRDSDYAPGDSDEDDWTETIADMQHNQRTMLATMQYILRCAEQGTAPVAGVLEEVKNLVALGAESDEEDESSDDEDDWASDYVPGDSDSEDAGVLEQVKNLVAAGAEIDGEEDGFDDEDDWASDYVPGDSDYEDAGVLEQVKNLVAAGAEIDGEEDGFDDKDDWASDYVPGDSDSDDAILNPS
jgi:hypothetical protein